MAQQYNLTLTGHPDLRHWLRQHVMDQHHAPGEHDTYVSSGTNHALEVCPALCLLQLHWQDSRVVALRAQSGTENSHWLHQGTLQVMIISSGKMGMKTR